MCSSMTSRSNRRLQTFTTNFLQPLLYRYTKLRLFGMAADFDIILCLDCDMIALGRVEAVLDHCAPNGSAPQPLAVARDLIDEHASFNTGVMAIQPNHAFYKEMIAAGKAGVGGSFHLRAEQTFLNAFVNTCGKLPEDSEPHNYRIAAVCQLPVGNIGVGPGVSPATLAQSPHLTLGWS